jgi:NAD(P)H-flavin reductase
MVRDYVGKARTGHRFVIIHGASYHNEFIYDRELAGIAAQHPTVFTYIPTISRPDEAPNAGWGGRTGRAHSLCESVCAAYGFSPADTFVYACGHPGMVTSLQTEMGAKGYPVRIEKYW